MYDDSYSISNTERKAYPTMIVDRLGWKESGKGLQEGVDMDVPFARLSPSPIISKQGPCVAMFSLLNICARHRLKPLCGLSGPYQQKFQLLQEALYWQFGAWS